MSAPKYQPSSLATLPATLDPAEYDISPEARRAQAERLAIRSRLKREYLLQYNDPSRRGLIAEGAGPPTRPSTLGGELGDGDDAPGSAARWVRAPAGSLRKWPSSRPEKWGQHGPSCPNAAVRIP
uniref:NADH dehydrogenase [ubiquinone] 1 beta subcomplex subunit 4 n=1 Tax=Canis lupus familiaris TaxID=9615 RepID=A0A8P0PNM4_CANLF